MGDVLAERSLSPLLSRLHPNAVLITTPPKSHYDLAAEALLGGAHVLVEKPMALQVREARLLVDLARSQTRRIWVGFNRRFRSAYAQLRARLARAPGHPVRSARFELISNPAAWGSVSSHLSEADATATLLHDIAAHQLDLLPWVLGTEPTRLRTSLLQRDARGTRVRIELQFPRFSATCLAGHIRGYTELLKIDLQGEQWLAGPGGLIRTRGLPASLASHWLDIRARSGAVAHKLMGRPGATLETFGRQLSAWADAIQAAPIQGAAPVAADGLDGLRCVALVDACCRSLALEGAWVELTTPYT